MHHSTLSERMQETMPVHLVRVAGASLRQPPHQFAALMQGMTVDDRLADESKPIEVADVDQRWKFRKAQKRVVQATFDKNDNLLTLRTDGHSSNAQPGERKLSAGRNATGHTMVTPVRMVFAPEKTNEFTFLQATTEWLQPLHQVSPGMTISRPFLS